MGCRGFAGDGGAATNAELDTPMGLAAGSDGRIFVADSHNDRIRAIATNGVINTFAGNGVAGYAGDGGPAIAAELALPRGLMVTSSGAVIFADSNNQRLRMVDPSGTITTIAGSGVQGAGSDGEMVATVSMNSPRGVALSSFGAPVYADALNQMVRESVANGHVYVPAGLAPNRTTQVALSTSASNGQTNAVVTVAGSAGNGAGRGGAAGCGVAGDADDAGGRIGYVCSADALRWNAVVERGIPGRWSEPGVYERGSERGWRPHSDYGDGESRDGGVWAGNSVAHRDSEWRAATGCK